MSLPEFTPGTARYEELRAGFKQDSRSSKVQVAIDNYDSSLEESFVEGIKPIKGLNATLTEIDFMNLNGNGEQKQ